MGQGTLTGLASWSPRSSNATGRKSPGNIRRPARASPASACGATSRPAAAAASARRTNMCGKGGAAAREMLKQAAANEWKVPVVRSDRRQQRDHAQAVRPHHDLRQGGGSRRQARAAEGRSSSRIRRTGRSPASRSSGSTPLDKLTGKQVYGADLKLPGMLNAAIKECPVQRRQAQELRRRQGREDAGREEGRAGRRLRASPSSPTPGGRPRPRSTRCRSSGTAARTPRSRAQRSPNGSRPASTPRRRSSAIRTATPRPRSPARPRRSRRSTPIPTRTTPAWSR